jgi:PKD repeat protein
MLRSYVCVLAFFISLTNVMADDCFVPTILQNRTCATEFFSAKSQKDLDDYLNYGKFKNGSLLNLQLDFSPNSKEINIATSCEIKLSQGRSIRSSLNGICLKGSTVTLSGLNSISADKKAPINITAERSVTIISSKVETDDDLNIVTTKFLPLDGNLSISFGSLIKANKVHLLSKSNLTINLFTKFQSPSNIFDGGNCEVNESKVANYSDDDKGIAKIIKNFALQIGFTGTCSTNPISSNIKLSRVEDTTKANKVTFNVVGSSAIKSVNWIIDDNNESLESSVVKEFLYPGKHFVQAIAIGNDGYFRKIEQLFTVNSSSFNKGQYASFYFYGSKNYPSTVSAIFNLKPILLTKIDNMPEIYFAQLNDNKAGIKILNIPTMNFQININLKLLPSVINPNEFINQKISSIIDVFEENNNDALMRSFFDTVTDKIRSDVNSLNNSDQAALADLLQANSADIQTLTTSNKRNQKSEFNLLNLFLDTANADDGIIHFDFAQVFKDNLNYVIIAGAAGTLSYSYKLLKGNPDKKTVIFALVAASASLAAIAFSKKISSAIIESTAKMKTTSMNLLISEVYAGENVLVKMNGIYAPLDSNDVNSPSTKIQTFVASFNRYNDIIKEINKPLAELSKLLPKTISTPQFTLLVFPNNNFIDPLSAQFVTDVKIISGADNDTSLTYFKDGNELYFKVSATKNQNLIVRVTYDNKDFGMISSTDLSIKINANLPKAVINFTKNNLIVNFDSTDPADPNILGLTYTWYWGDNLSTTTQSKKLSHTYSSSGTYLVTLVLTDSLGNNITTTSSITVSATLQEICTSYPITVTFSGGPDFSSGAEKDAVVLSCGSSATACHDIHLKVAFCSSSTTNILSPTCYAPEYGFLMKGGNVFLAVERSLASIVSNLLICQTPTDMSNTVTGFTMVNSNKYLEANPDVEYAGVGFGSP